MQNDTHAAQEPNPRPALPPVELDRDAAGQDIAPVQGAEREGNWFHRNRWFTKEPVTYTLYQFGRSILAALPYGPAMGLGQYAFGRINVKGQKLGLTETGIAAFQRGSFAELEKMASEGAKVYQEGQKAVLGRNMMRVANSPINAAVQIAMGFTLFRFTGGVVKNIRDRVMNPKNTAEDTAREVRNIPGTIWETTKTNLPAEAIGTPIAALVLGFMNSAFAPNAKLLTRDKSKTFVAQVKEAWSPKSKLLQNAAVWTFSYSLFFLLAESLFKDVQVRRGLWKGHPNSLKNGPDDTVGGPGAPDFKSPENDVAYRPDGSVSRPEEKARPSQEKLRYPALTGEPSLGRFIFRRVLPVAVGISGYAAMKRVGYLAAGKPMEVLTVASREALREGGLKAHAGFIGRNAWREGLATATFGALWVATDAAGSWYDKFVHQLQNPQGTPAALNGHQQAKHSELLERLNAKDKGAGRAA